MTLPEALTEIHKHRAELDSLHGEVLGEVEWVDTRPETPPWLAKLKRDKPD